MRRALTDDEEKRLLNFLCKDKCYKKYYDEVIILLRTGMRISEMCGLTLQDIDFKNRKINIDHQLIRTKKMEYIIETQKTKSSIRQIPMTDEVYRTLKNTINNRKVINYIEIDGKRDFLFIDKLGKPKVASHYQEMFRQITNKFNKLNNEKTIQVTPHILRHTFCTKMAHLGMNPKTLQFIMGHSDISITLNLYTHASFDNALQERDLI
ncbi:MAG: site-specific integrase [Clostridium sp.]|uniref:site-specific integrase n=1 Tax=Clostridium TaxID=1485 RepID=UPI000C06B926|nr:MULTISPECIES: site-specific integrase [Clostridium]MDB2122240.1 site-specific integrase [Clostridium paraputrificum]MDU1034278.1 site-specific integrase [Clostridium sp.]MDU1076797.1 site-specific integrase [Clostridium sp.]MDU1126737.1 site-specific integrase [Clostridium sp.]MDU2754489.1 site-specific integrase [Clostridium sp.]